MKYKQYDDCITLDGRLDEPIWGQVTAYSGFKAFKAKNSSPCPVETEFRIVSFADRIFIGVKCAEPNMEAVCANCGNRSVWTNDAIELFLSPAGNSFAFYQFVVSVGNQTACNYYSEGGQIRPDPYAPEWNSAVYRGADYWSVEIEIPLTAFYMTSNTVWSSRWQMNVCRDRVNQEDGRSSYYTWSDLDNGYIRPDQFNYLDGFPVRPACDDLRMEQAVVDITQETADGWFGTVAVKTVNPEKAEFEFMSDATEPVTLTLEAGMNDFVLPCRFEKCGQLSMEMKLKRLADGKIFKRYYPVRVVYEAIRLHMTLPEYRDNFYPGQDYSKIAGRVISSKQVSLKLEGPGLETRIITPNADGGFCFETSELEVGEAWLTAFVDDFEIKKRIRRLAPTGHMMTWISNGNLIVDGEPVLRRNMYAVYYRGGEAFNRRYDADDLRETAKICGNIGYLGPDYILQQKGLSDAETKRDAVPCKVIYDNVDDVIEANKDRDFAYYYLSDEPECRGVSPIYLKYLYEYIAEKDPYHVILMACRAADRYQICADWIECHPYIDPQVNENGERFYGCSISSIGSYITRATKQNRTDKCIGFLPTCFTYKWRNVYSDYPTFAEYVCHTWAAMVAGAKSLWPYAYHDLNDRASLYEGSRYIFSSFEALEKIMLFAKRTDLVKDQRIHAVLYELGNEKVFAVVNFTNEFQTVALEGVSGTWHEFRHNRMITGNTFELKPLEVLVGTSEVKDAGLPTYEEVEALVEKLEYERTHTGSLLFNKHRDIVVTASLRSSGFKLFDGVRDNHSWEHAGQGEKFCELDLTKVQPAFQKVAVYGYNVDTTALKVRNGGELTVPEIAEVKKEEFAIFFRLKETISPEALRLEFDAQKVELYEIEVY